MNSRLPKDWKKVKLGTLMRLVRRRFEPNKDDVRPYVGLEHILPEKLRLATHGWSYEVESTKFEFKKGDILFGKLRPYFRKVIYAKFDGVCSTDIWVIRPNNEVDGRFLFYRLASWEVVNASSKASSGTKMPRAQWDFLVNYEVPIPPLYEQKKIAEILGSLDDKIELNYEMNKTLEAIAQAIFKHWFIDFGPFKDQLVYNGELGRKIPRDWDVKPFSEVIYVNPKRKLKRGTLAKKVSMPDLKPWQSWIESWCYEKYNSGPTFKNGDTLFARITPSLEHGKTALVSFLDEGEIAFGTTEFIVLSPKIIKSSYYVFCLSRTYEIRERAIRAMSGSSGRQRVPNDIFDYIMICVPPPEIVDKFNSIVHPLFELITINAKENRVLTQIRDALLPKLLSGEIRVKVDIEEEFPKETKKLVEIKKEKARIRKTLLDYFEGA